MLRMLGKLPVEIEYMSVRVTLSQDRNESKNVTLHSKTFAIGLDQALRGQFGSAVKRSLNGKRTCLRRGKNLRLSVDRSGRRKNDPLAALLAHRLQHIPGGNRVLIEILAWMLRAKAHIGIRREMNHQFGTLNRFRQHLSIKQVRLMKRKLRMYQSVFQKTSLPGRHIVEPNDAVACGEQAVGHVTADKAS